MRVIVQRFFIILVLSCFFNGFLLAASEYDDEDGYLSEDDYAYEEESHDYLEPWNRLMFHFNDRLYFVVLKPVTEGYVYIVPEFARLGMSNVFSNLSYPARFTNCLLQGKGEGAASESARFFVNSAFGLLGLIDIAKHDPDLRKREEDFGQTLGVYGAGGGAYIVWPFLGPSTVRDTIGYCGDALLNPVWYINPWWLSGSISSYERINALSFSIGDYETFKDAAFEPYVAMKDGYFQLRKKKVEE